MKKRIYWLLLVIFPAIFSMCVYDIDNHRLLLQNDTHKALCYRLLADSADWKKNLYVYHLKAHDSVRPLFVRGGDKNWEYFIDEYSPDSILNIYLFDTSGIDSNKLSEQVIVQRKYKRLRYRISDLDRLKWKVVISNQDIRPFIESASSWATNR